MFILSHFYQLSHKFIFRGNSQSSYERVLLLTRVNSSENRLLSFSQSSVIIHIRKHHFSCREFIAVQYLIVIINQYFYERRSLVEDRSFPRTNLRSTRSIDQSIYKWWHLLTLSCDVELWPCDHWHLSAITVLVFAVTSSPRDLWSTAFVFDRSRFTSHSLTVKISSQVGPIGLENHKSLRLILCTLINLCLMTRSLSTIEIERLGIEFVEIRECFS